MKRFIAFFQLIRWPNLVFIALTQFLFVHFVINPVIQQLNQTPILHDWVSFWLVVSCICIAAGGYIINDYFDANRDLMTRPDSVIIGKTIHRHWAIACHSILSAIGVGIGFYLDVTTQIYLLGPINLFSSLLLFLYSISLKKKPLAGNIIISLLTAWSILVCTWCDAPILFIAKFPEQSAQITRLSFVYGGFAFIVSIIREAIKDMEDIEIDRKMNYKTMPILWGMNASRIFVLVWMIVMLGLLLGVLFYQTITGKYIAATYCLFAIILPFSYLFFRFFKAKDEDTYRIIRSNIKWTMLAGILSMLFIHF